MRSLLLKNTWWHAVADAWLTSADLRSSRDAAQAAAARMRAMDVLRTVDYSRYCLLPLPMPGGLVCNVLEGSVFDVRL